MDEIDEKEPRRRRGRPTVEAARRRKQIRESVRKHRERKAEEQLSEEAELLSQVPDQLDEMPDADLDGLTEELRVLQLNYSTATSLDLPFYIAGETADTRNARLELAALKADGYESEQDWQREKAKAQRIVPIRESEPVAPSPTGPYRPGSNGVTDEELQRIEKSREKEKSDLLSHMLTTGNAPSWLDQED